MGNNQSTPGIVENRRPSKSRTPTGFLSPASRSFKDLRLAASKSALTVYDVDSPLPSPTGDWHSVHTARQSLRSALYLPDNEEDEVDDEALGAMAAAVSGRLSPNMHRVMRFPSARSSATQLKTASQLSFATAIEPRTVDLEAAIAILQELRKTASPEDLVALRASDSRYVAYQLC